MADLSEFILFSPVDFDFHFSSLGWFDFFSREKRLETLVNFWGPIARKQKTRQTSPLSLLWSEVSAFPHRDKRGHGSIRPLAKQQTKSDSWAPFRHPAFGFRFEKNSIPSRWVFLCESDKSPAKGHVIRQNFLFRHVTCHSQDFVTPRRLQGKDVGWTWIRNVSPWPPTSRSRRLKMNTEGVTTILHFVLSSGVKIHKGLDSEEWVYWISFLPPSAPNFLLVQMHNEWEKATKSYFCWVGMEKIPGSGHETHFDLLPLTKLTFRILIHRLVVQVHLTFQIASQTRTGWAKFPSLEISESISSNRGAFRINLG